MAQDDKTGGSGDGPGKEGPSGPKPGGKGRWRRSPYAGGLLAALTMTVLLAVVFGGGSPSGRWGDWGDWGDWGLAAGLGLIAGLAFGLWLAGRSRAARAVGGVLEGVLGVLASAAAVIGAILGAVLGGAS